MPEGVIAEVVDGFATIDFVDKSLKGPALNRLIQIGGPQSVETLTREGPRRKYRVPEGNASEAGLLDNIGAHRGDTGWSAALVDADVQKDDLISPTIPSSRETFVGTTTMDEAREGAHVSTTLSEGSGSGVTHPPLHSDVITAIADAGAPAGIPEPNADGAGPVEQASHGDFPIGLPEKSWKRDEINAYAQTVLGIDVSGEKDKDAALAVIADMKQ